MTIGMVGFLGSGAWGRLAALSGGRGGKSRAGVAAGGLVRFGGVQNGGKRRMSIDSEQDLAGLRAIGRVVALALAEMRRWVAPGVTTLELDAAGAEVLRRHGANPTPQRVYGFPGAT